MEVKMETIFARAGTGRRHGHAHTSYVISLQIVGRRGVLSYTPSIIG